MRRSGGWIGEESGSQTDSWSAKKHPKQHAQHLYNLKI